MAQHKDFSQSELEDKNSPLTKQALGLSFEYIMCLIAETKFEKIKDFKLTDSFDLLAVLSNPFFVSVANGHSKSLYSLFGDFYTFADGPVSMSIHRLIQENNNPNLNILKYFQVNFAPGKYSIEITSDKSNSFEDLKEEILNTDIKGTPFKFNQLSILSDQNIFDPIYSAIEEGFNQIQKESNQSFFNGNKDAIFFRASFFPKFKEASMRGSTLKIDYKDIEEAFERPFVPNNKTSILSLAHI